MASTTPVPEDPKEGVPTYTAEYLRTHPKKRKELLASPDGTIGKDVAQQVEAAAPLIRSGTKYAREWGLIHGRATEVTRKLAEVLVNLRQLYTDANGNPDMRGSSLGYREAAAQIYLAAGFDEEKTKQIRVATRWHTSKVVREVLNGPGWADGNKTKYARFCAMYNLNPHAAVDRQKETRKALKDEERLPALILPADDVAALWRGSVSYAHRALEATVDVDPSDLPEEEREALREEIETIRARAEQILEELGDV